MKTKTASMMLAVKKATQHAVKRFRISLLSYDRHKKVNLRNCTWQFCFFFHLPLPLVLLCAASTVAIVQPVSIDYGNLSCRFCRCCWLLQLLSTFNCQIPFQTRRWYIHHNHVQIVHHIDMYLCAISSYFLQFDGRIVHTGESIWLELVNWNGSINTIRKLIKTDSAIKTIEIRGNRFIIDVNHTRFACVLCFALHACMHAFTLFNPSNENTNNDSRKFNYIWPYSSFQLH